MTLAFDARREVQHATAPAFMIVAECQNPNSVDGKVAGRQG